MIIVTGGAGFIGSNLVNFLNDQNYENIVSIDYLNESNKKYFSSNQVQMIDPEKTFSFLNKYEGEIKIIIHLGAISSTTTKDPSLVLENNLNLSLTLKQWCYEKKKRFIYASSAATYGNGSNGFLDETTTNYLSKLLPLNLYGWSKQIVDLNIFKELKKNNQLVGLKFFNVYGPNEYHKGDMKSIVLKVYNNVKDRKFIELFKSHNKKFKDGEQLRDFIYVKDVIKVIYWFIENPKFSGLFNVGTGKPRSFNDLTSCVYRNFNYPEKIRYIDTPKNIRSQYQYFTKARMSKLRKLGFKTKFFTLEEGINDYINNHLK